MSRCRTDRNCTHKFSWLNLHYFHGWLHAHGNSLLSLTVGKRDKPILTHFFPFFLFVVISVKCFPFFFFLVCHLRSHYMSIFSPGCFVTSSWLHCFPLMLLICGVNFPFCIICHWWLLFHLNVVLCNAMILLHMIIMLICVRIMCDCESSVWE